ncbi:MAG: gluconolactonase [Leptolyngbya sp. SIO4C1]|nr:gluconolactonase [Leptolyngbya sp. SIO4C1]
MSLVWVPDAVAQLPPIYDTAPQSLAAAESVASLPVNTFLENVVVAPDGVLYVTSHETGSILRVEAGEVETYAQIAGKVAGIALGPEQTLVVTGANETGMPAIFQVAADGAVETLLLPDAVFLNGVTPLSETQYLVADSYLGAIWQVDVARQTASMWLEHPLLARANAENPIPGVNGLKVQDGILYASNTEQMRLLKIPINALGEAEAPEIWLEQVNIDDFDFDAAGNLYGATHIYNSVVAIAPDGRLTTIATAEAGVTGSTAVALSPEEAALYVVTNGGMFLPPPEGVLPAQIVRLNLDTLELPALESSSL